MTSNVPVRATSELTPVNSSRDTTGLTTGPFATPAFLDQSVFEAEPLTHAAIERLLKWSQLADRAYSANTRAAWRSDWGTFTRFCLTRGLHALPATPETVSQFIEARAAEENRPSSIERAISTISRAHQAAEIPNPCATETVLLAKKAMRRVLTIRQEQARGLVWAEIQRFLQLPIACLRDERDRALVAFAYDTMCRSAEIVAFDVNDISTGTDGSGVARIQRSKTDQEGEGSFAYLSPLTVKLLDSWLRVSSITSGAIFRQVIGLRGIGERLKAPAVADRLRRIAQWIGLPPDSWQATSAHSTRVGGAQDLSALGIELPGIMQAGRWKDSRQVIRYTEHLQPARGAMARAAKTQGRT